MSIIQRYLLKAGLGAFMVSLLGLTSVIWITQALREFDLLTTKGQSFWIFLGITGLGIPILIMVIAPVALFIGIVYVLNRLNSDSELVVLSAAGISPAALLIPFAILALLATLLIASLTLQIMPWSFQVQKDLITKVRADFLTRVVEAGQFIPISDGFLFHYRERGPNGELLGLFMQDSRDAQHTSVYIAESGSTLEANGGNFLIMQHGSVQRAGGTGQDSSIVTFDRYAIDLSQFTPDTGKNSFVPRERTTKELIYADVSKPDLAPLTGRIRAELHDRFINPLYALAFMLIGFAALGQARTTRQGRGAALLLAISFVVAIRIGGAAASTLMLRQSSSIILAYMIPIITSFIAVLFIFGTGTLQRALKLGKSA
jgi:lipopolysaccharide export system permease protein